MKDSLAIQITNRQVFHYAQQGAEMLSTSGESEGFVLGGEEKIYLDEALGCALMTLRLAKLIGISVGATSSAPSLPYDDSSDSLVFDAPNISNLVGQRLFFLRGWKDFNSCVKGFNALGLIAEQVMRLKSKFLDGDTKDLEKIIRNFLVSRKSETGDSSVDINELNISSLLDTEHETAALVWFAFSERRIVCSTSSNMGIALHDLIGLLRRRPIKIGVSQYSIFNDDEGGLVIWAPDRRADFMNEEKAHHLSSLENEPKSPTIIRTYINRKERDPGAVSDAIRDGGYFFPTNPQSKLELKSLMYTALAPQIRGRKLNEEKLSENQNLRNVLESLDIELDSQSGKLVIKRGVEGGIYGLMVPYFVFVEELLSQGKPIETGLEIWNQASIGAALAAATLAADLLTIIDKLNKSLLEEFQKFFPRIVENATIVRKTQHQVIGVFDLANIQSLAQLLGVVVEKHLSGKGTPFVGLGSSSYSNGNLCFDILQESASRNGSFSGKDSFHPSTHTLNFVSQALIYGEDLYRAWTKLGKSKAPLNELLPRIMRHVRKPEPAGATSLTGLLLKKLDADSLSVFELAYHLRLLGFSREAFLVFCGFTGPQGSQELRNLASEEGPYMGQFMSDFLTLLEWPTSTLKNYADQNSQGRPDTNTDSNRAASIVSVYLTGDNTAQPPSSIVSIIVENLERELAVDGNPVSKH
ncbi:MAG: hypothetical protein P8L66_07995 [Rhodospirillaceae bacterium]|nr:hypothetical protein [Rhodospirillaceae bacterium]